MLKFRWIIVALGLCFFQLTFAHECGEPVDLLVVGDSQSGATWSRSYFGNFLPECLKGTFKLYGRGGTSPTHWLDSSAMDHIETIQRDSTDFHQNLGSGTAVPECKKRIPLMLSSHQPKKVLFQFGGNMILLTENEITRQIGLLMDSVVQYGLGMENCFFLSPTYEMEVRDRRNVPHRNLKNILWLQGIIEKAIAGRCQFLSGVEMMTDSPYFDGKELLKRVQIDGLRGCGGLAVNDNVHVCGESARDWAQRVCEILK